MHLRRKLVAGNWKMNGSLAAARRARARSPTRRARAGGVDVAICPPFTLIAPAVDPLGRPRRSAPRTATRPRAAPIPAASPRRCSRRPARGWSIVGHSERRAEQHESDADVRAKAEAALRHGLIAIVCVGESEAERAAGRPVAGRRAPARRLAARRLGGGRAGRRLRADLGDRHRQGRDAGRRRRDARRDPRRPGRPLRRRAAAASASSTAARSRPTMPPSCSPSPTSTAPWSAAPA